MAKTYFRSILLEKKILAGEEALERLLIRMIFPGKLLEPDKMRAQRSSCEL